jgi:hypothetical protein
VRNRFRRHHGAIIGEHRFGRAIGAFVGIRSGKLMNEEQDFYQQLKFGVFEHPLILYNLFRKNCRRRD